MRINFRHPRAPVAPNPARFRALAWSEAAKVEPAGFLAGPRVWREAQRRQQEPEPAEARHQTRRGVV